MKRTWMKELGRNFMLFEIFKFSFYFLNEPKVAYFLEDFPRDKKHLVMLL